MIRTSILSFGMSGKVFHAPFINAHPDFKLKIICERSKNTAHDLYPDVTIVRTVEEAIQSEEIDLVIVNTPSITHYDYAKMALKAGKHVIVEKPFTTTLQEAEELTSIAKEQNVVLAVYHNRRNDGELLTLKDVIDSGKLGKLVDVEMHFDRFAPDLSYKTHKEQDVKGVGVIYDLGSHLIDSALYLFGLPEEVYADASRTRLVTSVDDMFEIIFYYADFKVVLKASSFALQPIPSFIAHGQNGSFLCYRNNIQEERLMAGIKPAEEAYLNPTIDVADLVYMHNGEKVTAKLPLKIGNYMEFFNQVSRAIIADESGYVTGEEGKNVIQVIEKAYESIKEKRRIRL